MFDEILDEVQECLIIYILPVSKGRFDSCEYYRMPTLICIHVKTEDTALKLHLFEEFPKFIDRMFFGVKEVFVGLPIHPKKPLTHGQHGAEEFVAPPTYPPNAYWEATAMFRS